MLRIPPLTFLFIFGFAPNMVFPFTLLLRSSNISDQYHLFDSYRCQILISLFLKKSNKVYQIKTVFQFFHQCSSFLRSVCHFLPKGSAHTIRYFCHMCTQYSAWPLPFSDLPNPAASTFPFIPRSLFLRLTGL